MDWFDQYLTGMGEYKVTVSPADTHQWGTHKPSKQQQSLIQDSMAFDVQQMRLIQEAREQLEKHGSTMAPDPGSPTVQLVTAPEPIPSDALQLWLKADTGITTFSYNYPAQIIISGTSVPEVSGTYVATSVPTWSFVDNQLDAYQLAGPGGKTMNWDYNESNFILDGSFTSSNGVSWSLVDPYVSQITITGLTGVYAGANGVYTRNDFEDPFDRIGGGFYIENNGLYEANNYVLIATNNNNYQGAWTPATFVNQVTLSDAGSNYVNGVYTRTSPGFLDDTAFSGPTTLNFYEFENQWWLGNEAYSSPNLINWFFFNTGEDPVPTAIVTTAPKPIGSPTSTTATIPRGTITGSVSTVTVNTDNLVIGWADQSGNANDASRYGDSTPSTYSLIEGKSFVSFAETAESVLANAIWGFGIPFVGTIFTVARFPSSSEGGNARLFTAEADTNYFVFGRGINSTDAFFVTNNQQDYVTSSSSVDNNTNYILETTFDEQDASIYLNGILAGTSSVSNNIGAGSEFIGGGEPSSIAEMIVYNRVLTTQERQQVEAYLVQKYSITLPTVPGAPAVANATCPSGEPCQTLLIEFTAPASDGGAAITDYEYSVDDGETWASMGRDYEGEAYLYDLSIAGEELFVRVRAVNAVGAGASSAQWPEFVCSTCVPSAPYINNAEDGGDCQLLLNYGAPDFANGTITHYELSIDNGASWTNIGFNGLDEDVYIGYPQGLETRSMSVRVRAVNATGAGAASVMIPATLQNCENE